ncbi:MAG: hypothetical protein ABSF95_09415 [Verrucomicrobiota bacterium]|jgi:hypothetical protein
MSKRCEHINEDGTFKGGFDGCVLHMMAECGGGHSEESAKKICGKIAQMKGKGPEGPQNTQKTQKGGNGEGGRANGERRTANGEWRTANGGEPLLARLSVAAPVAEDGDFMVLPAGVHECGFSQGGRAVRKKVNITGESAAALQRQLELVKGRSALKPFFDFDHRDEAASAWPQRFYWVEGHGRTRTDMDAQGRPAGVYVRAERSEQGRAAMVGKAYQAFSMVFHVDKAEPANVVCNPEADLNFGGLVNDPAFKEIAPLWAKAERAEKWGQKNEFPGAGAPGVAGAQSSDNINQGGVMNESEIAGLQAKLAKLEQENTARRKKDAAEAVQAAVKRGALPAKDEALKGKWQKLIEEDPENIVLLAGQADNPAMGESITRGERTGMTGLQAQEGPARVLQAYGALAAKNSSVRDLSVLGFRQKGEHAKEMAAIYAREIAPRWQEFRELPLLAADVSDTNLGMLSGTLVAQRTLQLFKLAFPAITRVFTDFSDMPAQFKQTEATRIVVVPAVQTYNTAADASGRPQGWSTVSTAQTKDVLITLDEHVGVPIVFDANTLASTMRRLFDEQAPAAAYALARYFVEKVYKLFTLANYNAYAVKNGAKVPNAYASYKVALGDFARSTLTKLAAIFNPNEVPINDRVVLLGSDYFEQLATDPSLVTFFAGQREPEIVTENRLPRLAGFEPIEAPNLTAPGVTANLVGMALHKAGVVAKTRLSNDYTQALPGSSYGSVTTITDPDTGISVVLVQYVNHTGGYAEWRIQVMLGAAVGDNRGGLCITSQ